VQQFRVKEEQIQKESNLKRLRLLEDLEASLQEAAANNDVVSFINIQKRGNRDLGRLDQDSDLGAQERSTEFRQATEEAIRARQEEIDGIRTTYQQRLQTELAGQKQVLTVEQQFQQQRAALQQRRTIEDTQRQQRLEEDAFNLRRNALTQQGSALLRQQVTLEQQAVAASGQLGARMAQAQFDAGRRALEAFNPFNSSAASGGSTGRNISTGGSRFTATAFATGGIQITDRPSVGVFSENYQKEAHIAVPLQASRGIANDLRQLIGGSQAGGGRTYNLDLSGVNFAGASEERIKAFIDEAFERFAVAVEEKEASL
jgi:hypothetical protein